MWLDEARLQVPLESVVIKQPLAKRSLQACLVRNLPTCRRLSINYKRSQPLPAEYLTALGQNSNLVALKLHNCSFPVEKFCETLSSLYANCPNLRELSLQNIKLNSLPAEKLKQFYETLLSSPHLEELCVDLSYNKLREGDVDLLVKTWRERQNLRRLASLSLDSELLQNKVDELVLDSED